jgi:hypothetical protein
MIYRNVSIALLAVLGLGACAESDRPEATGKGSLRGINAIATSPEVRFMIEERTQGLLDYKSAIAVRFDDLSYNVNFDAFLAGDTDVTRIASLPVDVVANTEYLFMLTGSMTAPVVQTLEYPQRQWSGSETVFEARALHIASTVSDVDVYYATPGTAPVLGAARASLAYGEISAPFEVAAGDYELILTARDDPADILYRSRTLSQAGANSVLYGVFDPDPSITGDISVRVMGTGGQSVELADDNAPPTLRLMHAAFASPNIDLYANDDFTTALVSNLAFGELSADFDFELGSIPLTVTPAGDTGVELVDTTLSLIAGSRNSVFLVGEPAEPAIIAFPDNHRPIETTGRLRLIHLAANVAAVDLYVYEPTEDINDVFPRFFSVPSRASTGYANVGEGSYLVAIALPGEKDIIAGPLPLDLALGDVVEFAMRDTVDPNLFELLVYDN